MRKMRRVTLVQVPRQNDPFFADVEVQLPLGVIREVTCVSGGVPVLHIDVADSSDNTRLTRMIYARSSSHGVPEQAQYLGSYTWGNEPIYLFISPEPAIQQMQS